MRGKKGYTFLELMVTVAVLSIGIVGIYKVLLASVDYQTQLSCRLYASHLMENEVTLLEQQYLAAGDVPAAENGKVIEAVLDHRAVPFQFSLAQSLLESKIAGLAPVEVSLSWPDRDKTITIKRNIYLVNLNIKPTPDAPENPTN